MTNHDERRKRPRIQLKLTFSMVYENTVVTGDLIDLSPGGICFTSKIEFSQDSRFFLTLPGNDEMEIGVQVVRCDQLPYASYKIAAKFVEGELPFLDSIIKSTKGGMPDTKD